MSLLLLVSMATASKPIHVHLAAGHTPECMTVSWACTEASAPEHWPVSYSHHADTGHRTVYGERSSYTTGEGYTSPWLYHTSMCGLEPNTQYKYTIAGGEPELSFRTLPEIGSRDPLRMAVLGDLGQTPDSLSTIQHMMDAGAGIVLHAGDMSYADGDHGRWDSWFPMIEPLAQHTPYMVTTGNHEIETDRKAGTTFTAYKHRFDMPEVQPGHDETPGDQLVDRCCPSAWCGNYNYGNSFYSFEFGMVHVVALNAYSEAGPGSKQYAWVAEDLAQVDRSVTPWVVAITHSPWYNSNTAHQHEYQEIAMRKALEPVFLRYRVNVVLSGHVHAYERSFPVAEEVPGKGPVYLNVGDAGNREGHAETWEALPVWSAFRDGSSYGHSLLCVVNATHLHHEWHRNQDPEWSVRDEVWITQ